MTWLQKLAEKQDKIDYTIQFIDGYKPKSIKDAIEYAITRRPFSPLNQTRRIGGKRKHQSQQFLGTSRSIQDLHLICRHYFPKTTVFDVANYLKPFIIKNQKQIWLCSSFLRPMVNNNHGYYEEDIIKKYLT